MMLVGAKKHWHILSNSDCDEREKLQWVKDSMVSISVVQVLKENPVDNGIKLFVKCPRVYR